MEWISVKDRLPSDVDVFSLIVWLSDGDFAEAEWIDREFREPYYGQTITCQFLTVTHWAIPKPPKD